MPWATNVRARPRAATLPARPARRRERWLAAAEAREDRQRLLRIAARGALLEPAAAAQNRELLRDRHVDRLVDGGLVLRGDLAHAPPSGRVADGGA